MKIRYPRTTAQLLAALLGLAVVAMIPSARAETGGGAPTAFLVPTAWRVSSGEVEAVVGGAVGIESRAEPFIGLATGLGDLAQIDLALSDRIVSCDACPGRRETKAPFVPLLGLKIGLPAGLWVNWQPAVALGFRKTVGASAGYGGVRGRLDAAELYAVAGDRYGAFWWHAGANLFDLAMRAPVEVPVDPSTPLLRPMAAIGAQLDATTFMAEFAWAPEIAEAISSRWMANAGVRYEAYPWLASELGVRVREGDELENAVVFIRLRGRWSWGGDGKS